MGNRLYRQNKTTRRWVIIPLLCLLFVVQSSMASLSLMPMPPQPSNHDVMLMSGMHYQMDSASDRMDCHSANIDHCGSPDNNQRCDGMANCMLCHASSALAVIILPAALPTDGSEPEWQAPYYESIIPSNLDRPPLTSRLIFLIEP